MNIHWDAETYIKKFDFVPRYGEDVLNLLDVPHGSFVADVGCGNGALTEKIRGMGYETVGLDASEEMIETARSLHPDIWFQIADALDFRLEKPADAVFSNAVFHWIAEDKQLQMAKNIAKNLRDGGLLVTEFGGAGCAERVHHALEKAFASQNLIYPRVFYFPTIGQYTTILEAAGFRVEYAILFNRPTPQKTEDGLADWIRMFVKAPFQGMGEDLKEKIIHKALDEAYPYLYKDNTWYVDYVRIRIKARKLSHYQSSNSFGSFREAS